MSNNVVRCGSKAILLMMAMGCAGAVGAGPTARTSSGASGQCVHPSNTAMADVTGIDVSSWQGAIQFARFPSHIKYVFVKATQGATHVDRDYASHIRNAREAGLSVGSYHYFMAGTNASDQFQHFVKNALVEPGDLPPVVDIEVMGNQGNAELANELKLFLSLLQNHYGGSPIIYAGRDFANHPLNHIGTCPLWLAEYTTAATPVLPTGWQRWTFWQKSQTGKIDGIPGCVDLDSFNGDSVQFAGLLLKAPIPRGTSVGTSAAAVPVH